MTVESFETPDGAGQDAGIETEGTQPAAPAAPAERTYRDSDMAAARRSWETRAARERDAAIQQARAEWQRSQAPKPATDDPWADFDPDVARRLRSALEREVEGRVAPFKTELEKYTRQQQDLELKNDEADLRSRYKDYGPNRVAILELGAANGIKNIEAAYHVWRSQTQWKDPEVIGKNYLAKYQKDKAAQSAGTPQAEGRGGGSPSTKTSFRGKDGKLDKDAMDAHALELMRAAND